MYILSSMAVRAALRNCDESMVRGRFVKGEQVVKKFGLLVSRTNLQTYN